jgi:chemotaxis protein MotB
LLIAGRGKHQPIASNDTPEGRSQNRRVTLEIIPIEG